MNRTFQLTIQAFMAEPNTNITITIQGRLLKKKCTFKSGLCLKYIYVYNGVTIHRIVATGHHQSMKGFRGSWNRRILILLLVIITHDTTKITDHLLIYCKHLPNTHRFHDHGISQSIQYQGLHF